MNQHSTPSPSQNHPPTSSLVLIAEDDEAIALLLAMTIKGEGHRVLHASDGQEALDMVRRYHPALLITDLMMPRMNGAQVIAALRSSGTPTPLIILTTAEVGYIANTGADAIVRKPFEISEVEKLLRRFLGTTTIAVTPDSSTRTSGVARADHGAHGPR